MDLFKKISFKSIVNALQNVCQRFPIASGIVFLTTIYSFVWIWCTNDQMTHFFANHIPTFCYFIYATALSITINLTTEGCSKINRIWANALNIIIILLGAVIAFWWEQWGFNKFIHQKNFLICQLGAEGIFAILVIFILPFIFKGNDHDFIEYQKLLIKQLFQSAILFLVLMLGVFGAFYAVHTLFNINIEWTAYFSVSVLCCASAFLHFASLLPKHEELYNGDSGTTDVFDKVLGLYIIAPLTALYITILTIYTIKIVVTWELPVAPVTILVSILAITAILNQHILYGEYDRNKFVRLIAKWIWAPILPLVILMTVGLIYRINQYGITLNRCFVLLFNIWLYFAIVYLFCTESRKLKNLWISLCAFVILTCALPYNASNIVLKSQINRFTRLMQENGLFNENNKFDYDVIESKMHNIAPEIAIEICESATYIKSNYESELLTNMSINYNKDTSKDPFYKWNYNTDDDVWRKYYAIRLNENEHISILGYKYISCQTPILSDELIKIVPRNGDTITYNIHDWVDNLKFDDYCSDKEYNADELSIDLNSGRIIVKEANIETYGEDKKHIHIYHLNIFFLEK